MPAALKWETFIHNAMRVLWALTLFLLPVTSFRYMPFFGADSLVRPLSFLPAALLMLCILAESVRTRRILFWHNALTPLLIFILTALIATVAGYLLAPIPLYNHTLESRALRAWVTLGVGIIFLLTTIAMNRDEAAFAFSMRWLYIGFGLQFGWSLLQIVGNYLPNVIPGVNSDTVDVLQKMVSMTGIAYQRRVSGLAFEPSWLAAQLVIFYIPWLFASLLTGQRTLRRAWLDGFVLLAAVFILLLTFSRGGYLTLAGATIFTMLLVGRSQAAAAWRWFFTPGRSGRIAPWLDWSLRGLIILGLIGAFFGVYLIMRNNEYFEIFFTGVQAANLIDLFDQLYAGPRLAYFVSGWNVFAAHPVFGVGLGGVGLYMHQNFPEWVRFNTLELTRLLSPWNTVYPNTKNLFIRLLSETGLVGFWSMLSFYLASLGLALKLASQKERMLAFVGVASVLAWFSMMWYGFSLDSFALPVFWIPLGFLIGAAGWSREQA